MRKIAFVAILMPLVFVASKWSDAGEIKSPVSDCFLPAWFFEHHGFIGISDPQLDSVTGYNQALTRALTMYSLSEKTYLTAVYELYYHIENNTIAAENQKSHWLSEMSSEMTNYKYELLNYCVTKYGETIVEISVSDDLRSDNLLKTNMSMYFSFDSQGVNPLYSERTVWETESRDTVLMNLSWMSEMKDGMTRKNSTIDGSCSEIKNEFRYYGNCGGNNCDSYVFSDLKYGLWNAYIDLFLQDISGFRSEDAEIKVSGRSITCEHSCEFDEKNQRITRMIYSTDVACELKDIVLIDNVLYAKWNFVENKDFENKELTGVKSYRYDGYGYQKIVPGVKSKSRNESVRSASLHADSELTIMAFSSVNKKTEQYNLKADDMVIDTISISSRGKFGKINVIEGSNTTLKNDAYITTVVKEVVIE